MPSPESSRRNLEHARRNGRVRIWRPRSESQRIKAGIVLLHHTNPELSQRVSARTFLVSQPYVAKLLRRLRVLEIEKALGEEATELFRMGMEIKRQEHFEAASRAAEQSYHVSIPNPWRNAVAASLTEYANRSIGAPLSCLLPSFKRAYGDLPDAAPFVCPR